MDRKIKIKKLLYQSWYRGNKETDKILGNFAKAKLESFSDKQLDEFEHILSQDDDNIYAWVCGKQKIPQKLKNNSVLKNLVKAYSN